MLAAAMVSPALPVHAQVAPSGSEATRNGVGPADTIGPHELRDFSLGRPTAPGAQGQVNPNLLGTPVRTSRSSAIVRAQPAEPPPAPEPSPAAVAAEKDVRDAEAARTAHAQVVNTPPRSSVTIALPPSPPALGPATPARESGYPPMVQPEAEPASAAAPGSLDIGSLLPWLLASLVAGGAALAFAFRHRWRSGDQTDATPAFAGVLALPPEAEARAPLASPPPVPSGRITVQRPQPFATPTAPPVAPPAPKPMGIVSTRLRPWLEIAFEPSRAVLDEAQASVQFDVVVTNSGNAPARQVLVEACMINAGEGQDQQLHRFFDEPVGSGDRIDAIPPLGSVALKSMVSLPLDQVQAYEVGGRRLFVPVVALNALYEWGSGTGQSSASFIVGRGDAGEDGVVDPAARMAPLRLDLGPRLFRDLDARRHPLGVRR